MVNLLRKLERIDDEVDEVNLQMLDVLNDLMKMQSKMEEIDTNGMFANDDSTGTIFTQLKDLIDTLNNRYNEEITDE